MARAWIPKKDRGRAQGEGGGGPYLSSRVMARPEARVSAVRVQSVA